MTGTAVIDGAGVGGAGVGVGVGVRAGAGVPFRAWWLAFLILLVRGRLLFVRLLPLVIEGWQAGTEIARRNVIDDLDGISGRRREILAP
jgi:hypothetical protein